MDGAPGSLVGPLVTTQWQRLHDFEVSCTGFDRSHHLIFSAAGQDVRPNADSRVRSAAQVARDPSRSLSVALQGIHTLDTKG
jgi:hypothetical protein